jgi:hypothetical protein
MQLVVARVVAAAAVASEASTRTSLEAIRQSAEDRATTAEIAAATAITEQDSLASSLALVEAEVEKLQAAAASAEEAAERAKTAAAATESAARDTAQAAAREKATLEARVSELERDLGTAMTDLATMSHQFSQVMNQLQVVTEEAAQLRDTNAKLLQDLDGKSDGPLLSLSFATCSSSEPDSPAVVAGAHVIHVGMVAKLRRSSRSGTLLSSRSSRRRAPSGACRSSFRVSVEPWFRLHLCEPIVTSGPCLFFRGSVRAGAILSIPGAGRSCPELGPRRPTQVGGHQREGH